MSILMKNACGSLSLEAQTAADLHELYEILYADDTLAIGTCVKHAEELAAAIEQAGQQFGMTLHWGKTQVLGVCSDCPIKGSSGQMIQDTGNMVY